VVPQGYDYNIIFAPEGTRQPTRRILDREYPVPNKLEEYLNLYIGSKDASDVVLQTPHSNACTAKLRFRDIKKDKELLKYLKEYLIFVFGNRFKALAPDYEES
jgi:hypothetical protein